MIKREIFFFYLEDRLFVDFFNNDRYTKVDTYHRLYEEIVPKFGTCRELEDQVKSDINNQRIIYIKMGAIK